MSFLYIEPREVRHEVLVRVRNLLDWSDLNLKNKTTISADEVMQVKERANAFFMKHNPVKINGAPATPVSAQTVFLSISQKGLQVIDNLTTLDISTALIGVILSYPVNQLPENVSVLWELFDDKLRSVPTLATDPAGPFPGSVNAEEPKLKWQNHLVNFEEPKVSSVIADHHPSAAVPMASALLGLSALGLIFLAFRSTPVRKRISFALSFALIIMAFLVHKSAVVNVSFPFSGPPNEVQAANVVRQILVSANHALLEKKPTDLRHKLSLVVLPEAIENEKKELSRALEIEIEGSGKARTKRIGNLTTSEIRTLDGRRGFRTLADWTAEVQGGHWGHSHRRTVQYRALMEIVETNKLWKLAGLTVLDAKFKN